MSYINKPWPLVFSRLSILYMALMLTYRFMVWGMSFVPKKIVNEDVEVLNECHINQAAEAGSNSHNSDAVSCCSSAIYFNTIYKTVLKILGTVSVALNFCKNFKNGCAHEMCDQIQENIHDSHIQFFNFHNSSNLLGMTDLYETGRVLLSSLNLSNTYIIHLWFLWISKCMELVVWAMHDFPNSVMITIVHNYYFHIPTKFLKI